MHAGPQPAEPGWRTIVLYGIGDIANSVRAVVNGVFLFFFYTSVMGLPGTLAGIGSGVGLIWDALIDPYIGNVSDRAHSPWGRRHGLMIVGSVCGGLTLWAVFSPPQNLPTDRLFAWLVTVTILGRLAGSCFAIPYLALGAELNADYDGRTRLAGVRGICSLVGGIVATVFTFVVFFPNTASAADPKLNYSGYPAMGLALGVVVIAAGLIATLGTWGLSPAPRSDTRQRGAVLGWRRFRIGVGVAFSYRSFRMLFASFSLIYLGCVLNVALFIHFLTYYARIADSGQVSLVRGAFYASAVVGTVLWLGVAPRLEKRVLYVLAALATAALMFSGFVLVGDGRLFGTGDVRPLVLGQILGGLATSVFWIVPASMLADITDVDALATHEDHKGLFFGIASFGQKLVVGLSALIAGVLIDRFAGLIPGQSAQSAVTTEWIGLLASVLPAALVLIGVVLILGYPLDRRRVGQVQTELSRTRRRQAVPTLAAVQDFEGGREGLDDLRRAHL